jgi:hypothetical protein
MTTKLFFSTILSLITVFATAQNVTFKVLSVKGANAVQKGSEYVPLGPGAAVPAKAKVMVGEGGVIQIANSKNETFTLNKAGIYTMDNVSGKFNSDNSSLAQRYLSYVFNEMKSGSDSRIANLTITGSVERSVDNSQIQLLSPESTKVLSKETAVSWIQSEGNNSYKVDVLNLFDEPVISKTTEGTAATLALNELAFDEDAIYKVKVQNAEKSSIVSSEYILRIPTAAEIASVQNEINALRAEGDESALFYDLAARVYAQRGFFLDATASFQKAIALEPDNDFIRKDYEKYLTEIGRN